MEDYEIFTIKNLREWLMYNHAVEGLSEQIIAPSRAWAIIHNPYVKYDDPVLAAIFENHEVAAYTAAFPEMLDEKRIWWFSTLWCNPKFQGNGYSMIVIGSLSEIYGEGCAWDRSGVPETVEVFTHQGNLRIYTPRYIFGDKDIDAHSIRGKMALIRQNVLKYIYRKRYHFMCEKYELKYITHIDDTTYDFIRKNRNKDLFLHTKEMLNWELQYPFMISSPIMERVSVDMAFHSYRWRYQYYAVQVWRMNKLIGFYLLRLMNEALSVVYCYADSDFQNEVYASIVDHICRFSIREFYTELKILADYVDCHYYFPKRREINISFSPASNIKLPAEYQLQLGDGDCFA